MIKEIACVMMVSASLMSSKFAARDMNTDIYALQSRLAALGYFNIKITGMYGTLTETAFKKFQHANGFEVTGIVTDEQLSYLYSLKAKPNLDSRRNISANQPLSSDSFSDIDKKVTQSFDINLVTINKTASFKVNRSQGYLTGELQNIKADDLNAHLRYPVIATIQGVNYPASMDISGNQANLHFKDSISFLGVPDSEHQFNINRLLGF